MKWQPQGKRPDIGIWIELPPGSRWANEGMVRLIGFMIEGAARYTGPRFHLMVPHGLDDVVRADMRTLKATEHTDWVVHAPPTLADPTIHRNRYTRKAARLILQAEDMLQGGWLERMVAYANEHVLVDGWIVLHPFFRGAERLKAPRAVVFPDAIPLVFPSTSVQSWSDGGSDLMWRDNVRAALGKAPLIITFSKHVANYELPHVLGIKEAKIRVIPHAPPDVSDQLTFVNPQDPRATGNTRRLAAEMLRAQARKSSWAYLIDFAFEDAKYVVISTQDRATKNIGLAAEAIAYLLREQQVDIKLITTAHLLFGAAWTTLPAIIEAQQLQFDIVSTPDLPRPEHAALYHGAQLVIHPSFFEGGHGPFPFYEALSVGCPCLMARGPHTEELVAGEPELERYLFDPYDSRGLANLISATLMERDNVLDHQLGILKRLKERSWADVAIAYGEAAQAGAPS